MNRATTQRRHIFKGFSVATLPKENDRTDQKKDLVGNSSHLIQQFPEEDQGLLSETKTKKLERRCSFFFSHQTICIFFSFHVFFCGLPCLTAIDESNKEGPCSPHSIGLQLCQKWKEYKDRPSLVVEAPDRRHESYWKPETMENVKTMSLSAQPYSCCRGPLSKHPPLEPAHLSAAPSPLAWI
jgi:hypothetical protein